MSPEFLPGYSQPSATRTDSAGSDAGPTRFLFGPVTVLHSGHVVTQGEETRCGVSPTKDSAPRAAACGLRAQPRQDGARFDVAADLSVSPFSEAILSAGPGQDAAHALHKNQGAKPWPSVCTTR